MFFYLELVWSHGCTLCLHFYVVNKYELDDTQPATIEQKTLIYSSHDSIFFMKKA